MKPVAARDLWPDEARDFTPWLSRNLSLLGNTLGLDLCLVQAEVPVGSFRLDLLGQDLTSRAALLIENQLEPSDHRHFGQLMTYAAGRNAVTIVWIATVFRQEHLEAVRTLNADTPDGKRIFAVEIVTFESDDGGRSGAFRVVAAPGDWQETAAARESERLAQSLKSRLRTRQTRATSIMSQGRTSSPPRVEVSDDLRENVVAYLQGGLTPDQIYARMGKSRAAWLMAIEEEARQDGVLATEEASPESVAHLRDVLGLRWERIAVRVCGDPRKTAMVKQLYDQAQGSGASRQSYTGRGRRFAEMED